MGNAGSDYDDGVICRPIDQVEVHHRSKSYQLESPKPLGTPAAQGRRDNAKSHVSSDHNEFSVAMPCEQRKEEKYGKLPILLDAAGTKERRRSDQSKGFALNLPLPWSRNRND